ncbi:hypothetical protein TSAR_007781 [Trichomalopsis sarcophagae]|uniref:Uncharacterized protein n=1 Tax=Trichomalopsis sarcophagae TaxID=543379 RepID=A0A232FLI4_9HYME|nr:hypothetical protein TSAR_007781 [Trichomalopsis sarcophagae]
MNTVKWSQWSTGLPAAFKALRIFFVVVNIRLIS